MDEDIDGEVPNKFKQDILGVVKVNAANERLWLIAICLLPDVSGPARDLKNTPVFRTLRFFVKSEGGLERCLRFHFYDRPNKEALSKH